MKNLFYFLSTLVVINFFQSCSKNSMEEIDPIQSNSEKSDESTDLLQDLSQHPCGAILLDKQEYDKLPKFDFNSLKPLPGFEFSSRSALITLKTPPIADQGSEASCTAFAIGYCLASYCQLPIGKTYTSNYLFSPEYIYNRTKINGNCSSGAYANKVFDLIVLYGSASWGIMPYSDNNGCSAQYPPNYAPKTIKVTHINPKTGTVYYTYETYTPSFPKMKLTNQYGTIAKDDRKVIQLISSGNPVVITFSVDSNFDYQTAKSPYIYNNKGGTVRGSQTAVIMGYNSKTKLFKVQNSWGTKVHDKGYFYLPIGMISQMNELYAYAPIN